MSKLEIACICSSPAIILLTWGILTGLEFTLSPQSCSPNTVSNQYDNLDYGIPGKCDQVINREGYALGYIEDWEQPAWVTYRMTAEEASANTSNRGDYFAADPEIKTGSATLEDYANSGYDRGHLAPAADMRWSDKAMKESFLMSNMSPQLPMFNRRIWMHVEKTVREFAKKEKSIFVVTGPIFYPNTPTNRIGRNNVAVPHAYYKVIYDETPPEKSIGFIVPHSGTNDSVMAFAVPVSEVEKATFLQFFSSTKEDISYQKRTANTKDWGF